MKDIEEATLYTVTLRGIENPLLVRGKHLKAALRETDTTIVSWKVAPKIEWDEGESE